MLSDFLANVCGLLRLRALFRDTEAQRDEVETLWSYGGALLSDSLSRPFNDASFPPISLDGKAPPEGDLKGLSNLEYHSVVIYGVFRSLQAGSQQTVELSFG